MKAGTQLIFEGSQAGFAHSSDMACTAGPVLRASGFFSNLTASAQAFRYVITAGHCASVGQAVRVADTQVGKVTWVSGQSDLALVRIDPYASRSPQCFPTTLGHHHCQIVTHYEPRATGQVILARNRLGQELPLPVTGSGVPQPREIYCVSGAQSGVNCTFVSIPTPAGLNLGAHVLTSETHGAATTVGDSGGPVVSRSGKIYGIHVDGGRSGSQDESIEGYIPISQFFHEQPGYALVIG
ncbi:hypothetical protein DZF93_00465 [Clavibacter michiganensis subsp. insidiosus]|uniref:Peptidase S1 domain-containing protein n=1 Tax=Clavibacter michiganensis subsp. insidiosus TaxID=33014 RepID=A0A399SNZ3_9MICO|nr:hypothetical protein DZF93_00465 [Clavibacter michiganensis subsp. insidiosus]